MSAFFCRASSITGSVRSFVNKILEIGFLSMGSIKRPTLSQLPASDVGANSSSFPTILTNSMLEEFLSCRSESSKY